MCIYVCTCVCIHVCVCICNVRMCNYPHTYVPSYVCDICVHSTHTHIGRHAGQLDLIRMSSMAALVELHGRIVDTNGVNKALSLTWWPPHRRLIRRDTVKYCECTWTWCSGEAIPCSRHAVATDAVLYMRLASFTDQSAVCWMELLPDRQCRSSAGLAL
jgi:hypothetical protein